MSTNPQTQANRRATESRRLSRYSIGVVDSIPDENSHTIVVRDREGNTTRCEILTHLTGDAYYPPVGSIVYWRRRIGDIPVIVGSAYDADDDVPDVAPGVHRIGTPLEDTHVEIRQDSVVVVAPDGTELTVEDGAVRVNGGTTGVVTDVSHDSNENPVVTRSNSLFVP